jgi:hypothetical protein
VHQTAGEQGNGLGQIFVQTLAGIIFVDFIFFHGSLLQIALKYTKTL